jgi:hypothetical protein
VIRQLAQSAKVRQSPLSSQLGGGGRGADKWAAREVSDAVREGQRQLQLALWAALGVVASFQRDGRHPQPVGGVGSMCMSAPGWRWDGRSLTRRKAAVSFYVGPVQICADPCH